MKHCIEITRIGMDFKYPDNAVETVRVTVELATLDRTRLIELTKRIRAAIVANVDPGLIQHVRMFPVRDPDRTDDPIPPTANPNQGG